MRSDLVAADRFRLTELTYCRSTELLTDGLGGRRVARVRHAPDLGHERRVRLKDIEAAAASLNATTP